MQASYKLTKLTRRRTDGSRYWSWCIAWPDERGKRQRVSLGTTCHVTAETKAKRIWEQMQLAKTDSIGNVVERYLDSLNGAKDEQRKRYTWGIIRAFWGHLTLADIDINTSRTLYPKWRGRAVNTIRNDLSLIKAACRWAHEETKLIPHPPIIKLPAQPESKIGHLTKAEFRLMLDACIMPHVRLFCILAVTTGARKTALLEAKWSQVDWQRSLLDLQGDREVIANKGRATVALNDRAMLALGEARQGAISEYIIEYAGERILDVKKGVRLTAQRAGLKVHPHMFRHSAAVWMAEDRVPMSEIAAFLGHKDSRITERVYARYHPDYLRKASKSLDW